MAMPVLTEITPELFAPLLEMEEQLKPLKAAYSESVKELGAFTGKVRERLLKERSFITEKLGVLEFEEVNINQRTRDALKERITSEMAGKTDAALEERLAIDRKRLAEIPQEREAFNEVLGEMTVTDEESEEYSALWRAVRVKAQVVNEVSKRRYEELSRLLTIINNNVQAEAFGGGSFSGSREFELIDERFTNLRNGRF